jgi:hypothetical protein
MVIVSRGTKKMGVEAKDWDIDAFQPVSLADIRYSTYVAF